MNAIFTTYFTGEKDPQRPYSWKPDDFELIKEFYNSVIKYDLNCYILHDNLSTEFVEKYATEKITFIRVDKIKLNAVDYRWQLYYNLLNELKDIKKVFCLDISDVVILKDPFKLVKANKLYIGDEMCKNIENNWMIARYNMIKHVTTVPDSLLLKPVLNCGILGGSRKVVLDVTKKMAKILEDANITETTVDMVAANTVAYLYYEDNIVHGSPLNTKYRGGAHAYRGKDNGADVAYIQHK